MERYLCIHCHFYQPPRENPWLEFVELQESAYPYHDWNERITAESYAPNSASRILDGQGRITRITNNYSRISFNFGPTLLSWMEVNSPDVYQAILDADRQSQENFSGHGSAIAQAYNHIIMPLANRRDKETQVKWGIRDFESRFGRSPEGMWLPETAVDIETLEILADHGIKYTVLAPNQARQARRQGRQWRNVEGGRIDPKLPYFCHLPSGKKIDLFFYDGPISRAVAFERLLSSGENFADRLMSGFTERRYPQLMHIATDGETYGHHHRHGDMALAYALSYIESNQLATITNYGEFLEKHPPTHEVDIIENTSWSCAHGIERWKSDCGCNSGRAGWNQQWRQPLRHALDWLRDNIAQPFEENGKTLVHDPWLARNEYIDVVSDRSTLNVDEFIARHQTHELAEPERIALLSLLEMQRHALLMYTSCGWFFDELSGIETVQVIQYAGRAIQLAQKVFRDPNIEKQFAERLAVVKSNLPEHGDGAKIYAKWVKPAAVDLEKVAAHYAISSLFERYGERTSIYCYDIAPEDYHSFEFGKARLAVGRAQVTSRITRESGTYCFGVLHFGDHNLSAAVRPFHDEAAYQAMLGEARDAFLGADLPQALRILDKHFAGVAYSLRSLFHDEQRKIIDIILNTTLQEAESSLRQLYEHHAPLLRFLSDLGTPLPNVLRVTGEFVLNSQLKRAFAEQPLDVERIRTLLKVAQREQARLDGAGLGFVLQQTLERMAEQLRDEPENAEAAGHLDTAVELARELPFEISLWRVQNVYYEMLKKAQQAAGESAAQNYERLRSIGEKLSLKAA